MECHNRIKAFFVILVTATILSNVVGCYRDRVSLAELDAQRNDILRESDEYAVPAAAVGEKAVKGPAAIDPQILEAAYDSSAEITMREAVLGVQLIPLNDPNDKAREGTAVFLRLQPGGDFLKAYVGTNEFLIDHHIQPDIADYVTVTGPLVRINGEHVLLVRKLKWRNTDVTLRDENGAPLFHQQTGFFGL